jgi:hypothetical protein
MSERSKQTFLAEIAREELQKKGQLFVFWTGIFAEVQFDLFFAASHSADAQFRASAGLLTSSTASMHPVIAAARVCRIIAAPASCRYLSSHTSSIRNPL